MGSDGRLRRFLHLERARPAGSAAGPAREPPPDATAERIAGLERPAAEAPGPARPRTGARLERFGPEPEPSLELVDTDGHRPFIRCMRCGMDSNFLATACGGCGANLDTPEQHDFDERFWTARQAEAAREAQAEEARRERQARAEEETARARRAMGELLAREVGDRERRRLGAGWGAPAGGRPWSPLGLRLLRRIVPDERWCAVALAAAAGLATVLAGWGVHAHHALALLVGVGALVILLVNAPE